MTAVNELNTGPLKAINGGHLHWQDFREDVLKTFRIRCSPTPRSDRLPTTFLARLQASQRDQDKYTDQADAWRTDVANDRGLTSTLLFPPHLLPRNDDSTIRRLMSPRLSREGLPTKVFSPRSSLYELPTARPSFICGFNESMFEKVEHTQLQGGLHASGTVVDFIKGEVLPSKSISVPFLAFHKLDKNGEAEMEAARNACAITGSHFLRAQQQLFHKASGLQQLADPAINFTCALSNDHAIINCHYVEDDGFYTMAPLCKFDLRQDEHFKHFQAWIEAIESWATIYLLPRIKGSIHQVLRGMPSPPPSPTPMLANTLSIDTNSDNTSAILNALRRQWPMIRWQNDAVGETPINSSIAQCGTPFNARNPRNFALGGMVGSTFTSPIIERHFEVRPSSSMSQRMADLAPLRTDIPMSALPQSRQSIHQRRLSTSSSLRSRSDGSTTPVSPCRPPSLSPCTPGPEAPVSAKSPILVLQRRLDAAINEIQDLRTQVEDLQGQLNGRTEIIERRLDLMMERQEEAAMQFRDTGGQASCENLVDHLEFLVEDQESKSTPILRPIPITFDAYKPETTWKMPGDFGGENDLASSSHFSKELMVWCLAFVIRDEQARTILGILIVATMALCGILNFSGVLQWFLAEMVYSEPCIQFTSTVISQTTSLIQAIQECELKTIDGDKRNGYVPIALQ